MGRHRRSAAGRASGTDGYAHDTPHSVPDGDHSTPESTGAPDFTALGGADYSDEPPYSEPGAHTEVARPYAPRPVDDVDPGYGGYEAATAPIPVQRYDETYGGASAYGRGLAGYGTAGTAGHGAAGGFPDLTAAGAFPEDGTTDAAATAALAPPDGGAGPYAVTTALPVVAPGAGGGRSAAGAAKGSGPRKRSRRRVSTPVRTGLLGVSAAMALGAVAVAAGVLPGGDSTTVGNGASDRVRASEVPGGVDSNGGRSSAPTPSAAAPAPPSTGAGKKGGERSTAPAKPSPSQSAAAPAAPEKERTSPPPKPETAPTTRAPQSTPSTSAPTSKPAPSTPAAPPPPPATEAPVTGSPETQVVALVNRERAKVGCQPVSADAGLARLAENFSQDMAARGFFDHTDPDGDTPWDRAEAAGISDLGGENIARGQADAAAVMAAWMDSPGHRANILNCDFKTLGVGAHFASGGPWWTQNFGF
ncbi:CAP domain-containing protein [Streptomyces sp. NPDC059578]|uniref:CAP domain-containing protein n=1 Tax=unclassified Streptomyces TaxID=2593676 RepID=UPI003656333D